MLDFENVSFAYRHRGKSVPAVEGVSFHVQKGEMVALTGPSGTGKSTVLHLSAGLIRPSSGVVRLCGAGPDPRKVSIGLVPQQYGLLEWKKVRDNILLPLEIKRQKPDRAHFEEVVRAIGLEGFLDRYPHQLSGGQRQRVALARVFVQKPALLLLDEPFAALDLLTAEKSRELFRDIWTRFKVTTVMVTHNPAEAAALADRVILMRGTAPGTVAEVFDHPDEAALRSGLTA